MKKIKYYLSLSLICFSFEISARSVLDVISENKNLTIFYSYLERTDLKRVLEKELPWNWTIFAPSNKAFRNASKNLTEEILEDEFYSKNILMDHLMTGHTTSLDVGEKISTQITVSNKHSDELHLMAERLNVKTFFCEFMIVKNFLVEV